MRSTMERQFAGRLPKPLSQLANATSVFPWKGPRLRSRLGAGRRDNQGGARRRACGRTACGFAITFAALPVAVLADSSWTIVPSPNAGDTNALQSVACDLPSSCWAVGYSLTNAHPSGSPLIEHVASGSWSIMPGSDAVGGGLDSVACPSAGTCWAVGGPLVDHYSDGAWTPNANSLPGANLKAVTCVATADCWAVGSKPGTFRPNTLIAHGVAGIWSAVSSPSDPTPDAATYLNAVSCPLPSDCWAVGVSSGSDSTGWRAFVVRYLNGGWVTVPVELPLGAVQTWLSGVTCTDDARCWAVGWWSAGVNQTGTPQPLIEFWNGTAWTAATAPSTSAQDQNYLTSVACPAQITCWAVGYYISGVDRLTRTLIETYDSAWRLSPSPNPPASASTLLSSVVCGDVMDCWAVGDHDTDPSGEGTLIEGNVDGVPPQSVPEWPIGAAVLTIGMCLPIAMILRRRCSSNVQGSSPRLAARDGEMAARRRRGHARYTPRRRRMRR